MSELRGPRGHEEPPRPDEPDQQQPVRPDQPAPPDREERSDRPERTDTPRTSSTDDGRRLRDAYVDDPDDIFDNSDNSDNVDTLDFPARRPDHAQGRPDDASTAPHDSDATRARSTGTPADGDIEKAKDTEPAESTDEAGPAGQVETTEWPDVVDDRSAAELDRALSELERDHPDVGSVVRRLVADREHPLDLTTALADPRRRDDTLATIRELAAGRMLGESGDLQEYRRGSPGEGPLFEQVPREVNRTMDGVSRKDAYLARCEDADSARGIGGLPDGRQLDLVDDYARRLAFTVRPLVLTEVEKLAGSIPDATVSTRVKNAEGILDKVGRMTAGTDARPPRDDYRVGDVVDAVGARITVADTAQLADLLGSVCEQLGTGERGRVLELDNMYATPKPNNPSYRVVPLVVAIEANGQPYTYELQLTTRRASVAADLEHNTIYKPTGDPTARERDAVRGMLAEAAALDQEETRGQPVDETRTRGPR